jgi:hypothetical protein
MLRVVCVLLTIFAFVGCSDQGGQPKEVKSIRNMKELKKAKEFPKTELPKK